MYLFVVCNNVFFSGIVGGRIVVYRGCISFEYWDLGVLMDDD